MLISDFSQLAYAVVYAMKIDIQKGSDDEIMHIIRNGTLSMLRSYKRKFRDYSGQMVVACDGSRYWRYDIFPEYKASRKEKRKDDDMPWDVIKPCIDQLIDELSDVMPYKFIRHHAAEADDVCAIIVEDVVNKTPITIGLEETVDAVLLVNKDKDVQQLLKHPNVRMHSPYTQKFVTCEHQPKEFLRRLILTGDSGDGIPNIFSPIDAFVTKTRQSAATEKRMQPFLLAENMLDVADTDAIKNRLIMNTRLISFGAIPKNIRKEVVDMYHEPIKGSKMKLYSYLVKNGCDMLSDNVDEF